MLKRRKWLIFLPLLTMTVAVAYVVYHLPSMYESKSLLTLKPPTISQTVIQSLSNEDLSQRLQTISQEVNYASAFELLRRIQKFADTYFAQKPEAKIAVNRHRQRQRQRRKNRIVGFVSENGNKPPQAIAESNFLGTTKDLQSIIKNEKIDRVIMAIRERRGMFPTETLLQMSLAGDVCIEESTTFFERLTGQVQLEMVRPSWLIFGGRNKETRLKTVFRDTIHRLLAVVGLILSFPIMIIAAVLIKFESKGDIFYRQERVGKNGKIFKVIKFRSMRSDAEKDGKPIWATPKDDRVTRIGKIIRKIRVDEIPQFINIIKGEMSFVGPRPERPHFVEQLAEEIQFYEHRHLVAPGLTGWAQIKYPYGASVEDARMKLQYDLYYIKNQSLALDFVIFFETFKTVLFGKGAR